MPSTLDDDELSEVMGILSTNKDKNFVRRILDRKKYPTIDNGDGTHSTHLMAYSEVEGKHLVYPTITYDTKSKSLRKLGDDEALDVALKKNDYISFDDEEKAAWFAGGAYKRPWGKE